MGVKKAKSTETPLMKQYNGIKAKHPDALLLFRVGDFYETFGQDAVKAASVLGIVLTKRHNGSAGEVELAGFPHHSLENYLPKLVRAGLRVAVCDQLEDPKVAKKIVKRGVTELVTPGVTFNEDVLEKKENNFLCSLHFTKNKIGLAFLDVSTGDFFVGEGDTGYADRLLQHLKPKEVIFQRQKREELMQLARGGFYSYPLDDWAFSREFAQEKLLHQFNTKSLKGFGIEGMECAVVAAGSILEYLSLTQNDQLGHVRKISRIESDKFVWLDRFTIRNLELLNSPHESGKSLIEVLDDCHSPMGSRLLRRWLIWPLKEIDVLQKRHEAVADLMKSKEGAELADQLSGVGDLERLVSKITTRKINPRELNQLKRSLESVEQIQTTLNAFRTSSINDLQKRLDPCPQLIEKFGNELEAEAPVNVNKGSVIREGVNAELDELRKLQSEGKNYLLDLQKRETESTGISSLKVAFNNVFGYYIEVRNTHKDKVPEEWIRKQTLVGSERYITEELKEYEAKILGAEEKILSLESQLYSALVESLQDRVGLLQENAIALGELDCLLNFAQQAEKHNYVKPEVDDSLVIDIKDGRHPVIERQMEVGEEYISNDVYLDSEVQQVLMITGPNMAGKSALLRQTALIVLMAQIGSFVPARHARIGIVDKVFTRVGASDNISQGESTFMVEMNETASILNNISERSLILLDEIGRGTSTFDGISIAWSIAEFLHENGKIRPKTLFATHYHELNEMSSRFKRIKNFNVSIRELEDRVVFLRKLKPGGSEHSFGIHVAKMAGMPSAMIRRAYEVLKNLESSHLQADVKNVDKANDDFQLSFFQLDDPVLENIRDELTKIDIDNLTPVEALMKLNEIKKMVGGK